ncbi:hypothetical protein [Paraburkholderia youngii]|uniref:hypothetical protein n=1 Tax=Paraburkholderia youngii TaxID=2782701 RepID=UPI003D240572
MHQYRLDVGGINTDWRLSSLAELSLQMAITKTPANACEWSDARFDLWPGAARFAYAFLFLGERTAGDRAFEDRQIQVR